MASISGDTRCATASYIESMLAEMRTLSQNVDSDFLTYLLEMAMIEASDIASGKMSQPRRSTRVAEKPRAMDSEEIAALFMSGALK